MTAFTNVQPLTQPHHALLRAFEVSILAAFLVALAGCHRTQVLAAYPSAQAPLYQPAPALQTQYAQAPQPAGYYEQPAPAQLVEQPQYYNPSVTYAQPPVYVEQPVYVPEPVYVTQAVPVPVYVENTVIRDRRGYRNDRDRDRDRDRRDTRWTNNAPNTHRPTAPAPSVRRPEPAKPAPAPIIRRPEPVKPAPAPIVRRPEPVKPVPAPVARKPEPIRRAPVLSDNPRRQAPLTLAPTPKDSRAANNDARDNRDNKDSRDAKPKGRK